MKIGWSSKCLGVSALLPVFLVAAQASAQPAGAEPPEVDYGDSDEFGGAVPLPLSPRFDDAPGWSIGLDAYAGFAVISTNDGGYAHGLVGGISRFQWRYLQVGGFLEVTDGGEHHWRSIGGFAGAFVPFRNWVDFEFAAGIASRTYRDDSFRYGPDGYEATTPALTLRAGFSDRSIDGLFGLRLGAHIAAAFDFKRENRPWQYDFETSDGEIRSVSGTTRAGGFSIGLAMTAGFDIGRKGSAR